MTGDEAQRKQMVNTRNQSSPVLGDIQIRVIKLCDHDRVLDFLRQHYYREEPLTVGTEPKQQDSEDEKFNMSQIVHGTCLMAVQQEVQSNVNDMKESIIGVLLSGPKGDGEAEHLFEEAARFGATKWGTILQILAHAERDSNVYKRYDVSKALHIHVLAVDTKVRGRSIGSKLIEQVKDIGRQLKYPLLTVDCTSYYSAKLCELLAMDCVNVIKYDQHLGIDGKPVCTPPPPHEYLKTYASRI